MPHQQHISALGFPRVLFWPRCFLLCIVLSLGQLIIIFQVICYHCYADDVQLYISFKLHEITKLSLLLNCINTIKVWMANNYLQLDFEKTEVLISAPAGVLPKVMKSLDPLLHSVKPSLRNLSVYIGQVLCRHQNIKFLVRNCFCQLRNIAKLSISGSIVEMIIHAFISSHFDYCNYILTCLSNSSLI